MKFQPGQSGNPSGRPKGAKGRATALREKFLADLEKHGPKVMERAVQMAMAGDASVMNAVLDRLVPKLKPVARELQAPIDPAQPAERNAAAILGAMASGSLTVDDGTALLGALSQAAAIDRIGDLEKALAELFRAAGKPVPAALAARVESQGGAE